MLPRTAQIEITTKCNSDCVYCPHSKMERSNQDNMPLETFEKILTKCKNSGVKMILPFLNGEPFLHPDIKQIIRLIKNNDLACYLNTNMTVLNKELVDFLFNVLDSRDCIVMSIDTAIAETYKLMRGNDLFKQRESNMFYFFQKFWLFKEPFKVSLQRVVTKYNNSDQEQRAFIDRYFKYTSRNCDMSSTPLMNWGGKIESEKIASRTFCNRLSRDLTIMIDGRVCLCCIDCNGDEIMGDVNNQNIEEIYNSDKYQQYRINYPYGLCKNCNGAV